MNTLTPDRIRHIAKKIGSIDLSWYFDTDTKEIRRKSLKGWRRYLDLIWRERHKVGELYWWINQNWADETLIVFSFPMRHDNMPIQGFPMKFELQGGWSIPKADLRYLSDGPLTSEGRSEILVPANQGWRYAMELGKQFAPVFSIAAAVLGVGANWTTALEWYELGKSAFFLR